MHLRKLIDVGLYEPGRDGQLFGQTAGGGDGLGGEVHPRDDGAPPGPGHRVQAEMALQVQEALASDVSQLLQLKGQ